MVQSPCVTASIEFYFDEDYKEILQDFLVNNPELLGQNPILCKMVQSLFGCSFWSPTSSISKPMSNFSSGQKLIEKTTS